MAAKKRKPAIEGKPKGIIDDIIEVGVDVVRRSTRDMAKHHIASGKRMRREAKKIGRNEKLVNRTKLRDPLPMGTVNQINKSSNKSYSELKSWQDSRRKMRELIADAKGTKSVPTKASEARRAREGKQLKKKTGLPIKTARQKYYGEYNK